MPSASSARLKGDDYQHLFAWWHVLALRAHGLRPLRVSLEVPHAGALDDVVTHFEGTSCYYQVKFHVDHRDHYDSASLMAIPPGSRRSLLQKIYAGWLAVSSATESPTAVLMTNWAWNPNDPFAKLLDGTSAMVKDEFFSASEQTDVGRRRQEWATHLGITLAELDALMRSFRIQAGYGCTDVLVEDVKERMASIGLKHDDAAVYAGVGQVRKWIQRGVVTIDDAALNEAIQTLDLKAAAPGKFATVHLHTIVRRAFTDSADYELDWVDHFRGTTAGTRSRLPAHDDAWQERMLPDLIDLRTQVDKIPDLRLLKMRGQARLASWLATGFVFRETTGYVLEAALGEHTCRTDVQPSADFHLKEPILLDGPGDAPTLLVGISVTKDIREDVLEYAAKSKLEFNQALFLAPDRELGRSTIGSCGDLVALAVGTKAAIRRQSRRAKCKRVSLFYCGPAAGALFIGHQLNAVAPEVVVYEDTGLGYVDTFTLSD